MKPKASKPAPGNASDEDSPASIIAVIDERIKEVPGVGNGRPISPKVVRPVIRKSYDMKGAAVFAIMKSPSVKFLNPIVPVDSLSKAYRLSSLTDNWRSASGSSMVTLPANARQRPDAHWLS